MRSQIQIGASGKLIRLVHFVHPAVNGSIQVNGMTVGDIAQRATKYQIACTPELPEADMGASNRALVWLRTNDVRAVSCLKCMETEAYKEAKKELEEGLASLRDDL